MKQQRIFQATKTIANGLAWDFSHGMISHVMESSGKTMCGKSCTGGSSYGWQTDTKVEKTTDCPVCQKMKTVSASR
jgi:hypothetical protein